MQSPFSASGPGEGPGAAPSGRAPRLTAQADHRTGRARDHDRPPSARASLNTGARSLRGITSQSVFAAGSTYLQRMAFAPDGHLELQSEFVTVNGNCTADFRSSAATAAGTFAPRSQNPARACVCMHVCGTYLIDARALIGSRDARPVWPTRAHIRIRRVGARGPACVRLRARVIDRNSELCEPE